MDGELTAITNWSSGLPFSVFSNVDNSLSGVGSDRADYIGGPSSLDPNRPHGELVKEHFNVAAFVPNAIGTFGNSGKNILRGPRTFDTDLGLLKNFAIVERISLQFRAEFFNAFNNVKFRMYHDQRALRPAELPGIDIDRANYRGQGPSNPSVRSETNVLKPMPNRFRWFYRALAAVCILPFVAPAASVEMKQSSDRIEIIIGGTPFTAYYFSPDVAKPYLMPLQTPSGIIISRPFPVGNDASTGDPKASSFEPHQRPLYFAHGDIDGLNFWAEPVFGKYYGGHSHEAFGHMADPKLEESRGGVDRGAVRTSFALEDPNNRIIGHETQSFTFRGDDRTRTIDCQFELKADHGPIAIGDTKEGTFGIRLGADLSAPLGHMINSRGGHGEKEIWGKPADWVNYYGTVSGEHVGIVVYEHPTSFRHPTTWHARAYGLLAANPFGLREFTGDPNQDGSWAIPEGSSLRFRYRVVIYDGDLSPAELAKAYQEYVSVP